MTEMMTRLFNMEQLEYVLRILIAAVCGLLIGLEREKRSKTAGVRTHLIVALSAALMMIVSKYGFFDVVTKEGISIDASRIAAGVVTAIGFLGVGVIFIRNDNVSGVTTAAGLWATVGVGIAIGSGMYTVGVVATGFIVLMQLLLHKLPLSLGARDNCTIVAVMGGSGRGEAFTRKVTELGIKINKLKVHRLEDNSLQITISAQLPKGTQPKAAMELFDQLPEVTDIKFQN